MAVKKITKRWLFNSFGIILIIVLVLVLAASMSVKSYYYNAARQYIITRSEAISDQISRFYQAPDTNTFMPEIQRLIENYEYKSKIELMALENESTVIITSSGFHPKNLTEMPDYKNALTSANGVGEYLGKIGNEKVMAITVLTSTPAQPLSAMRYVISLTKIDEQIYLITVVAAFLGLAVICFVIFSSSYFVNSIIKPIGEMNLSTKKIAQGDFRIRLDVNSNDEIGELCNSINEMAEGLANSEQIKNDFISSVSHELRTPLTAIRGWGETIISDQNLDPETAKKAIQVIMTETERLSNMVEELLDFSKIQGGRLQLVKEKMDIIAELSDAILMFTQRAKQEEKQLIYDEPDFFAPVMGDRSRLRQVFINILDNALKYSDANCTITVIATINNGSVCVEVIDTGIGISEEDLPNIKAKFYKGKTNRRGSGIGLAIADEIITLHGGTLRFTSKKGTGTTASIVLPLI